MLLAHQMLDLIESTHSIHYFQHRAQKLRAQGRPPSFLKSDDEYEMQVENSKQQLLSEMAVKEEQMRQQIQEKMKEHEAKMRASEDALSKKEAKLKQELEEMRKKLEQDEKEFELMVQRSQAAANQATNQKKGKAIF